MLRFASIAFAGLFALMLLGNVATSQDTKKPDDKQPPDVKKDKKAPPLPKGWKDLTLTAEQEKKVLGIRSDYQEKVKKLEDQIKDLKKQENADLAKVLTDAQREEVRKALEALDLKFKKTSPDVKQGEKITFEVTQGIVTKVELAKADTKGVTAAISKTGDAVVVAIAADAAVAEGVEIIASGKTDKKVTLKVNVKAK